jgi:hypothetical protein
LSISNNSAVAIYEATVPSTATATYTFPIYVQAKAGAVPAPVAGIQTVVSLAPVASAATSSSIPSFGNSDAATVTGGSFTSCSTTLLFPFVTNQLGFDTGIAISNTSSDLLASNGTKSQATAQSGTCSMTFFGNTAPAAAVASPVVAAGTSYAAAASTLAPGFQGYMIASCNFLYAHGFAYVVYNLTQNNGAAMGYLADVITSDRKSPVTSLSATFTTPVGGIAQVTGLSYSGTTGVSSTNPESWGH